MKERERIIVSQDDAVAKEFASFAVGYVKTQITGVLDNCEYTLYLECTNNDEDVVISISNSLGLDDIRTYSMDYVLQDPNLIKIVESFDKRGVGIETMEIRFTPEGVRAVVLNGDSSKDEKGYYITNKETGKLELYFNKDAYLGLSDLEKSKIKSTFLFSNKRKIWVSRTKFPNLWRAEEVALSLGLCNEGKIGETLSFKEQMERKAERAEARAERYEAKSEKAIRRGKELQKPITDRHGDLSFFTQPNINSSAGRSFSRSRERMFAAYDKGFEEFKKSEYYLDRAGAARATAGSIKPKDKGFCNRRIEEAEKVIRAQKKSLETYNKYLERIRSGEVLKRHNQEILTEGQVLEWVELTEDIIEQAIGKSVYYHECLEELGGVEFSKENIKVGYTIELKRWGKCVVGGTGPKNITYTILEGGAKGLGGKASYAEIIKVLSTDIPEKPEHPFVVGEKFTVKEWAGNNYVDKEYEVTKVTAERVALKSGNERAISRKPRRFQSNSQEIQWALCVCDGFNGTVYKKEAL